MFGSLEFILQKPKDKILEEKDIPEINFSSS